MNNGIAVLPSQNTKPAPDIHREADYPVFAFTPQGTNRLTLNKRLLWTPHRKIVRFPVDTFYISKGKRWLDVSVSSLVLVFVLSWLLPLLGFLILLESPGPILFVQLRSGRRGKRFNCFKLRTMKHEPCEEPFRQTLPNDRRVTPLGRFLRKTNLDELPQFINVLIGDMSLVGPRPHAIAHDAMHWGSPSYRERYWVRPGITGLAQVRGSRGPTDSARRMDHRVRYDHVYIKRQTFLLDMHICLQTLALMLKGNKNVW